MKVGKALWEDPEAREEFITSMMWDPPGFKEEFDKFRYDELPDWVRFIATVTPKKGVEIKTLTIGQGKWFSDGVEYYEVVREFQVTNGFKVGDKVKVTVEKV